VKLRQLEYFVHVAELGSFTHASNFRSVAQPVLSRQVRALEPEFFRRPPGWLQCSTSNSIQKGDRDAIADRYVKDACEHQ
jgi:Bacterial regulatory helix-turn-helix protein, lysR family